MQIFLLYFYAGIKKTEADWLLGYSMGKLESHWVFDPFRFMGLSDTFISQYIVHVTGFLLDLLVGPCLLFDRTRPFAILALTSFHCMNSQMFSIGMFPYACLATMWVFCRPDSVKKLVAKLPSLFGNRFNSSPALSKKFGFSFRFGFFVVYAAVQLFLPYSHFITQGYNGWTQGAYGYSWDMMIHSFRNQHIKITYEDGETGEVGYLKPNAFMGRARNRWTMHPDMLKQYATCLTKNLEQSGVKEPKIYFDVWKSMNQRFVQRVYDPRIDKG
jgi:vitamin K-dependent gamma-carboxylase